MNDLPAAGVVESDLVLARLRRLHPRVIDLSLERIEVLLARLGHPEQKLPPVVHVAGTNGKGSLIAFLRAMLTAAGKTVQAYTSPHLVRYHERVRLGSGLIGEPDFVALLERCETANGEAPITEFEVTTVAALLAFAEHQADILLLETGLGGRLDATNVVAQPHLTVITPISIDHVQYLGDSVVQIAKEKAGILKPGVPAVIAPQPREVLEVIEARAAEIKAPLFRHGAEWQSAPTATGFRYESENGRQDYPAPALPGPHQLVNAGLAVACAEKLSEFALEQQQIASGLTEVDWPARLQRLTQGPLLELLNRDGRKDWELWLDGGHNAAAGEMLAESLAQKDGPALHIIFGMLNSKAAADYLRPLARIASSLQAVEIPGEPNSLTLGEAVAAAKAAGATALPQNSLEAAVEHLQGKATPGKVLICGSLYLAGKVLADHG